MPGAGDEGHAEALVAKARYLPTEEDGAQRYRNDENQVRTMFVAVILW